MLPKLHLSSALYILFLIVLTVFKTAAHSLRQSPNSTYATFALNLLPLPQKTLFTNENFSFNGDWSVVPGTAISKNDAAVLSLVNEIKERFGITIKINPSKKLSNSQQRFIHLAIKEGAVPIGKTSDTNREAIKKQAYRIKLDANEIAITANASAGLFYGVQTLLQLLTEDQEKVILPKGEIVDWPDLEMRMIYWDDAHHLERPEAMKRAIRQAAYYKINGFALKLEGHFQFENAKPIVEPYAYTPAEYQELTNYARERHVELIPFLDAPAHVSFILKHPEYANLRAYPDNNYGFSVTNPKTEELLLGMFGNLLEANKGGNYVFLSTDEAYYVGKPENEEEKAKALGGNGRLLAGFITKLANELHKKGRTVLIWGEFPLTANDITSLPSHLVNGVYNKEVASLYKQHGIRQLIYSSTQGSEPLFPSYYTYSPHKFLASDTTPSDLITDDEMQQGELKSGRVDGLLRSISSSIDSGRSDFMGSVIAGWGDSGLNPETFWLGYAAGSAAGWNYETATAPELTYRFYRSFYGSTVIEMDKIYRLLSRQAQFWNDSWEWAPLQLRTPIVGNSEGIFDQPRHLKDQTLLALPVPSGKDLSLNNDWNSRNSQRLETAEKFVQDNNELLNLLHANLRNASRQHYHLRVMLSIAQLCRQNLDMLLDFQRIHSFLKLSSDISSANVKVAVSLIDQALDQAKIIRNQRNETLQSLVTVWYEDWYPRVAEANGRVFLDKVDDIKDHVPVRTVDMSYLIYRQLNYPMDKWWEEVKNVRNQRARENNLPERSDELNWKITGMR